MPLETMKHRFFEITQAAFWDGQEAVNEFKVTCDPLKHRFFDFTQGTLWAGKEEENEFPVIGYQLKHRFFDLIKLHLQLVQRPEIS